MSGEPGQVTIPARITALELARTIGRELNEIQAVLRARSQPDSPSDVLDSDLAVETARILGIEVSVEPRDLALEHLYEVDSRRLSEPEAPIPGRAGEIVAGVLSQTRELDTSIEKASQHWAVARMPVVDRAILRLGLWELREAPDIPTAVIVSEAVRLANTYSTGKSGAFINGVLAARAGDIRGKDGAGAKRRYGDAEPLRTVL